jgi:iron complex outermembrane recepter protein
VARAPFRRGGRGGSKTSRRPASILIIALAAAVSRARAADDAGEDLGEVLVIAPAPARHAAPRDPTASATIIDTSSAPTRVETLEEALSDAVGVQVRRFGGLGDFSTVSIRGYGAGQVQLYLDGVPLGRADNEVVNLADLPLDAVDHIEVYRGASPLEFSQSGPGGVVNIVTRAPGEKPLFGTSASYGSFDTRKANVAVGGSHGRVSGLAFAHYLGSEGDFRFTNDNGTSANPLDDRTEKRRNNAFNLGDLTARLVYRAADPLTLTLTSESFVKEQGIPGGVSVHLDDASLRTIRQLANLEAVLDRPAALPLEVRAAGWTVYQQRDLDIPITERHFVPADRRERSTSAGGQLLARGALGSHQLPGALLALGHERFSEHDRLAAGPDVPDRTRLRGSIAAEDEIILFGERVSLVPGLRWEIVRDEFRGDLGPGTQPASDGAEVRDFLSPRFGVRVETLPGVDILGNIGRYARIPNLQELFGDSGFLRGNPELETETAVNRDLGVRARLPRYGIVSNVALEYTWFDNEIDDLIVFVQQSQTIVRPENVGAASLRGHEVAVSARFWDRVGVVGNYTRQRTRDESERDRRFQGNQLPGRPEDEAYARIELSWSREHPLPLGAVAARLWPGRVYYDVNFISDNFLDRANNEFKFVDSRTLHGVGLDLDLPVAGLRLGLEMKNAGDERTQDVYGFPLPGRALFATLSYGFGEAAHVAR